MKEANSRAQSRLRDKAPGELCVVAVNCNPAPDAEDRLRRLFTLLLEQASAQRQTPPPTEDQGFDSECKRHLEE